MQAMAEAPTTFDEARRDDFMDEIMASLGGAMKLFSMYIGDRLGLYEAMRDGTWRTARETATETWTQERYVREWLEQQTVAGVVEVKDASARAEERRFRLTPEHAEVLADRDSLNYLAPLAQVFAGAVYPLEEVLEAFQNGGGVPFDRYGRDMREGQARINRAMFLQELGKKWIPAMPDIDEKLRTGRDPRIADIGCGCGWSTIGLAKAYPRARVDGFDLDRPSVEDAQRNLAGTELGDRVRIELRDCGDPQLAGEYDLVTAFECVHDMSDPVAALRSMRRMVRAGGAVLVVDERVAETFEPEGADVDAFMYGWSVLHCLPAGMADQPSRGTGTVMRPSTLKGYAKEAGFQDMEVVPIDNYFFRFYRLLP